MADTHSASLNYQKSQLVYVVAAILFLPVSGLNAELKWL